MGVVRDEELGGFLAPFVMGTINTRVVRRSNALQGHAYGRDLRYRELMLTGSGPLGAAKAAGIAGGLGALIAGLGVPPTRKLLDRLLPDPGEGPARRRARAGSSASRCTAAPPAAGGWSAASRPRATRATRRPP